MTRINAIVCIVPTHLEAINMVKDLTNSAHDRQNILNNSYALKHAESHMSLGGVEFNGEMLFTKNQVMDIFGISDATVERYIANHSEELKINGYRLVRGKELKEFKSLNHVSFIGEGNKAPMIGVFNFRAILNFAMLLVESEQAKIIRTRLLDIVIDTLAEKTGGHTKYINQRDENYLMASFQEESYRKQFTDAIEECVEGNNWKYAKFTNLVYQSVFHEDAAEYRKILNLAQKDKIRDTMYSEVLTLIAGFESGIAHELKNEYKRSGRKLTQQEAENLFHAFESHPLFKPMMLDARTKMASRDLCFRDALHEKLEAYVRAVPQGDFERFLGEKSKSLEERLNDPETIEVFKRLKDR